VQKKTQNKNRHEGTANAAELKYVQR